jgi:hypothetical protein
MKIEQEHLGQRIRDKITGLEGICMAITLWKNGCRRANLQPTTLKDGKPMEMYAIDEQDIELVEPESVPSEATAERSGGDHPMQTLP